MPFLLRGPDRFFLIESRIRQGLICYPYTQDGFIKPILLNNYTTQNYTATLDCNGLPYVVTETNKHQLLGISYVNGLLEKHILFEDTHYHYMFGHLHLSLLDETLYLFYSVKHPTGTGRAFMCKRLDDTDEPVTVLLPSIPDTSCVKILTSGTTCFILYTDFDQQHLLKCMTFTQGVTNETCLYTSSLPITDFNACLLHGEVHITCIVDAYGKQQASYFSTLNPTCQVLAIKQPTTAPCLFASDAYLWLTYIENGRLFMMLSSNAGHCFSIAVPSSLHGTFGTYTYAGVPAFNLNGTTMHAMYSPHLRLAVLGAIDLKGIHPDIAPLTELDLLLEGSKVHHPLPRKASPLPPAPSLPLPTSSPSAEDIIPPLTPNKDIPSATKAFMDGQTLFDAPPKPSS